MRAARIALALAGILFLTGCVPSASSQSREPRWTTGFWFWDYGYVDKVLPAETLDTLFVRVGEIRKDAPPLYVRAPENREERWVVWGELPKELPPAQEYWLVFRFEQQGVPDSTVVPTLEETLARLAVEAKYRHLKVAGVQLDIDSPTNSLPQYAKFLAAVRPRLPNGYQLSITALLDWFRGGTDISEVIAQTDEFVPQFYDLGLPGSREPAIAAKVDAAQWGPVFNRFGKRFRIGVSTFGRGRFVSGSQGVGSATTSVGPFYNDVAPLEIATNPVFRLEATRNATNELVLTYRATSKTKISYKEFAPGDVVQFILATPDTIRAAVLSARQMGSHAAGVVFFRWPAENEALAMQPNEVLSAAGLPSRPRPPEIRTVDGGCAVVKCVDLYLDNAESLSPKPLSYRIRTSKPMEYFLPEQKMPTRMSNSSEIELTLPPYGGRGRLLLGRAVTMEKAEFSVEKVQ
jgi:hypothetical protein